MPFAQLSVQTGLRGIENGIDLQSKKLYHLAISKIKRLILYIQIIIGPWDVWEILLLITH